MVLAELFTMTEIEAPAERVWHILTDFARYPEWNPFIRRIDGEPLRRAALELLIQPHGARARRFRPRIVTFRPPKELRWRARARLPGLFQGEHRFVVEHLGPSRSRLIHEQRVQGLLVPFLRARLEEPVRRGFDAMNQALKQLAERYT
jgi:hypothetical protein